jgi:hypothetical protein
VARRDSGATAGEGTQNLLCVYLAAAVLAGLVGNSLWGWWWLDPLAGLVVAAVAIKEGRTACRGEDCRRAAFPSSVLSRVADAAPAAPTLAAPARSIPRPEG